MHNFHRVLQASKGPRNYIGRSQNHSYFSWAVSPSKDNQTDNWKNDRKKEIKGTFFSICALEQMLWCSYCCVYACPEMRAYIRALVEKVVL